LGELGEKDELVSRRNAHEEYQKSDTYAVREIVIFLILENDVGSSGY
jgi:hypothetical protein